MKEQVIQRHRNSGQRIIGALVCVLALAASSCKEGTKEAVKSDPPQVRTFHMLQQTVTDKGEWFGYLRGKKDTDIHPHVTGFLLSQEAPNGSSVKEGDILFRIDPSVFEAELAVAQANLQAAQANVTSAQAACEQTQMDVDRYTQLVNNGAVSEKELTDAQQRLRAARAAVDAAHAAAEQNAAAVQKAQINLDYTIIRAPYDGIMSTAEVSQGDLVSPATKLANITSVDPIRFDFSINSDNMIDAFRKYGDITVREKTQLPPPPPVDIVLEDGSTFPQKGKLTAMESKVSESGLINVTGEVSNPEHVLRGGMPVRLRIPLLQKEALLVPKQSIRSVLRNDFIIVVDPKNEPHMVPVVNEGLYSIPVREEDGYTSTQEMVAVTGLHGNLAQIVKQFGYEKPSDALVVADEQNSVFAANISSANSRIKDGDPTPRGTIDPQPFSYKPQMLPAVAAAASGQEQPAENPNAKASMPPMPVKVRPLLRQDVDVPDEWFGTLRGVEETDIRPQVSGFVLKQHFRDGAIVKKGDVLFTIDPSLFQAEVTEAQANLLMAKASVEQAQAQLDRARQDYERYAKLNAGTPGAISDKTLTDASSAIKTQEAAFLKAQASVAQMEAALRLAQINLDYTVIRAPFDGRVGIHKPSVGALVSPSDPEPLVTLSSVNPMRVDFQVSGKGALQGITAYEAKGDRQGGDSMPGFNVILEDDSVYPEQGHVVSADNSVNRTTGTLKVVGHVENSDGGLRSGMPVRVRAGLNSRKGAYLVPARAPMNAKGRDILVLVRPDGAPQMLPIERGALVNLSIADEEGKPGVLQPMQIVDVDRGIVTAMILAKSKAPSLEAVVLEGSQVKDWKELLLKKSGAKDARELLVKMNGGKNLPDDMPQKAGVGDWDALLLRQSGATDYRGLVLKQAGAGDELDLIASGQGYASVMEMTLKGLGFDDMANVPVVVEGSLMAAQVYAANEKVGAHVNKLKPTPYHYRTTRTVVESVTADGNGGSSSPNLPVDQHGASPQPSANN